MKEDKLDIRAISQRHAPWITPTPEALKRESLEEVKKTYINCP